MTDRRYRGLLRVHYPLHAGRVVLRTELDWDRDLEAARVETDPDGAAIEQAHRFEFELEHDRPFLFVKPVIHKEGREHWASGANKLVILSEDRPRELYPHFYSGDRGRITQVIECPSQALGRALPLRLYLPPGYDENALKRYPVIYMHDGRNLFFPEESFLGAEWQIDEHLDLLDTMSLIDRVIVVGIHAVDRDVDYTAPGYERYGRAVVEDVMPWVDRGFRSLTGPRHTSVMGSSLGGVASFFLAWTYPEVFGNVACLSSTFGYRDDLLDRVLSEPAEPRRSTRFYLDSGWPGDNYEVTLSLVSALLERGLGDKLTHLAYPFAAHNERAWAARVHVPLQLFSGKLRHATDHYALGAQPT